MPTPSRQIPPLASNVERRFYLRVVPCAPISIAFGESESEQGLLLNVSENGLLISTPVDLACNFVARISIPLSALPKPVQVTIRVVWASEERKLAGIQLLDLSEHDRQRIRKWGAQESAQPPRPEPDYPPVVVAPFTAGFETPPETCLFTKEAPSNGPHDLLPLAPRLIVRRQPRSTALGRAIFGVLIATVCVAAALFFRNEPIGKVFAHLTENRSQGSIAAPPVRAARGSLENPVASEPSGISQVATLAPIASASAAESKSALVETSAPQSSPQGRDDSRNVKHANSGVGISQAQPRLSRAELIHPSATKLKIDRIPATDSDHLLAENQTGARIEVSPTSAIPASADAAGESLPPFLVPSVANETSPTPAHAAEVPAASSATIPSSAPAISPASPPVVAPTHPEFLPKSAAPAVQPVVQMDPPRSQVFDVRLPNGYQPAFFLVPGERVLESPSVTMYIQRSVRMPATYTGWPFHRSRKVAVGGLVSRVDPQAAQVAASLDGQVRVRATITKDGRIQTVRPIRGPASLIPAVVKAVREWRYQPTLVDNRPVETQCYVVVQFRAPAYRAARR